MAKASYHAPKQVFRGQVFRGQFLLSQIRDLPWHELQQGIAKSFVAQRDLLGLVVKSLGVQPRRGSGRGSLRLNRLRLDYPELGRFRSGDRTLDDRKSGNRTLTNRKLGNRQLGATRWLVITTGAFALFYWNGRLLLATGSGVAVMLLVYLLHDWQPRLKLTQIRQFLRGWNQSFLVSVSAGACAAFVIYLAISIWAESDSAWIAAGAILQGLGTLAVLGLLFWQRLNHQRDRAIAPYHQLNYPQLLQDLTHEDSLKRLIAVRQLTDLVSVLDELPRSGAPKSDVPKSGSTNKRLKNEPSRRDMADYFRLMLSRESEPIVRDAVLDGLQTLDIVHHLQQATERPFD